jgi:GH15 family glucan-1,4-alpha-glucosidase
VVLDRAIKIMRATSTGIDTQSRQKTRRIVPNEALSRGWSKLLGAFRQRYEAENLDAAALLIPIMGVLPANHPRVPSTIERLPKG